MSDPVSRMRRVLTVVGTDYHPFHRLVTWVDMWCARRPEVDCLIQYGTSTPPQHARGMAYLGHADLEAWMAQAAIVVCHGGPSTILEARRHGLKPIVVPRRARLGEHVDDHQVRFVTHLVKRDLVLTVTTRQELESVLDQALDDPELVRASSTQEADTTAEAVQRFAALVASLFRGRDDSPTSGRAR